MASIQMRVETVGGDEDRVVARLVAVPDPENEDAAGGHATIILKGDDAKDSGLEVGAIFYVDIALDSAASDDPAVRAFAAARAIPNSTNTPGYKTPAALKVPPPAVPDGVVTLPRPSVIMEPLSDTPPDAGVTSGPPGNPTGTGASALSSGVSGPTPASKEAPTQPSVPRKA